MTTSSTAPRNDVKPDYMRLPIAELRRLIKSRSDKDHPELTRRRDLINVLWELDFQPFRFLDLPPELRNRIYELLLSRDARKKSKVHTSIMHTCKQIRSEAQGILEAECTVRLRVRTTMHTSFDPKALLKRSYRWDLVITGDLKFQCPAPFPGQLVNLLDTELSYLSRIQKLSLILDSTFTWEDKLFSALMRFLERVVDNCESLQRIDVDVGDGQNLWHAMSQQRQAELLRPLVFLSENTTLRFRRLAQGTEDAFWRMANGE